jgi:malto-oligosyltrehalose synthase
MIPRATYRLQFHAGFTFEDARRIVPYLDRLGISHIYASPITTAAPGSMHGYDVVDPSRVNPELGGEEGLRALAADLRERSMGLIIDIVPNHMGVAGDTNPWWLDVLEHGAESRFARYFDVDWQRQLVLPVLGAPLDEVIHAGDLCLIEQDGIPALRLYGNVTYPLRADDPVRTAMDPSAYSAETDTGRAALTALCERQHYRLTFWRAANDLLNWRRFFSINELAGLRVEDDTVFELTHALYFDLFTKGLIDGVRVDHVDGLTDPAGYCRQLRRRFEEIGQGRRAYIVVEKILAADEKLAPDWDIDGTSGYDFMREMAQVLHSPEGIPSLRRLWTEISARPGDFEQEAATSRADILDWQFEGQLAACVSAFHALAAAEGDGWITAGMLRRALQGLLRKFPVYRTYGNGLAAPQEDKRWLDQAIVAARRTAPPGEAPILDRIGSWLSGSGTAHPGLSAEAVRRFQQLAAPIAAKGVEDTAFYRHSSLLSLCDVGFDPARPAITIETFHRTMERRAAVFPHAMLTTATHDHKRGEDGRARLAVLSTIPEIWEEHARRWLDRAAEMAPDVHEADAYALLQTLVGAWDGTPPAELLPRLHGWQDKALREAQLRSSWAAPDETYETAFRRLADALLQDTGPQGFVPTFEAFMASIAPAALANSLAQTALRCLLPGVPDLYQGAEGMDYSMVDPDNRRAVDHARFAAMLAAPSGSAEDAKLSLIADLLERRRLSPDLFTSGDYHPVPVHGLRADHVIAFVRRYGGITITCCTAIRLGGELVRGGGPMPSARWWGDTKVEIDGRLQEAAEIFEERPVHVE